MHKIIEASKLPSSLSQQYYPDVTCLFSGRFADDICKTAVQLQFLWWPLEAGFSHESVPPMLKACGQLAVLAWADNGGHLNGQTSSTDKCWGFKMQISNHQKTTIAQTHTQKWSLPVSINATSWRPSVHQLDVYTLLFADVKSHDRFLYHPQRPLKLWSDWTPNIRWSFITDIKHTANLIAAFRWTKETKFGPTCLYLLCVKPFLHVLWVKWPEPAAWPLTLNRVCTAHSTTCCSDTMTADVLHICFLLYSVQPTIHFHTFIHNF